MVLELRKMDKFLLDYFIAPAVPLGCASTALVPAPGRGWSLPARSRSVMLARTHVARPATRALALSLSTRLRLELVYFFIFTELRLD